MSNVTMPSPPTTPTSDNGEGGDICKICGKKTILHNSEQLSKCTNKAISQEILKDIKDPI